MRCRLTMKHPDKYNDGSIYRKDNAMETKKSTCCGRCIARAQVQFSVYVTVMLFAMSTWTAIVGVWVEMPLLVDALPEAWSLPSHLTIIIQCSNLGPALYALAQKMKSNTNKKKEFSSSHCVINNEVVAIFIILVMAILAMMIKAFVWMVTVKVGQSDHSVPLFCLVGVSALVSCTSSVVFLPYMARFKPGYISAYYIGQGLCGMLPGLLGLAQGLGQEPVCIFSNETVFNVTALSNYTDDVVRVKYRPPLFSVSAFFGILALLLIISTVAFYILNFTTFCRAEMVGFETDRKTSESAVASKERNCVPTSNGANGSPPFVPENIETPEEENADDVLLSSSPEPIPGETQKTSTDCFIKRHSHHFILLTTVGILNALTNGLLPATQSYTCLPYGRITYTLSIRLSSIASPLASLSTLFLPSASLVVIILLMTVACLIALFDLILAGYSPDRLFEDLLTGQIVLILTFILMMAVFSYIRVAVASILRKDGGRRSLLWCGGVTQLGSFCGALIAFILVTVLHLFSSQKPCASELSA